jgi:hypothetical protein
MSEKPVSDPEQIDRCIADGPQSTLERMLLEAYLDGKGYSMEELKKLPAEQAQQLMKEACAYASMKLAEVESKAQFRREIHYE